MLFRSPDKIIEITQNGKTEYKGNYYDYLENQKTIQKNTEIEKDTKSPQNKAAYNKSKEQRSALASLRREKSQLEKNIEDAESLIAELEISIASPEVSADYEKLNEQCLQIEKLKNDLDLYMERWAEISEQIEE